VHLLSQRHVVATAVGATSCASRRCRRDPSPLEERLELAPGRRDPRTLENSLVAEWSWPCVIVFVDHWMDADEIAADPDEMVPRRLYLPDGKIIPTCVVFAPPAAEPVDADQHLSFPSDAVRRRVRLRRRGAGDRARRLDRMSSSATASGPTRSPIGHVPARRADAVHDGRRGVHPDRQDRGGDLSAA
jgi:hypothetical protein